MRRCHILALAATLGGAATPAWAQDATGAHDQRASIALPGIPFGLISGEYESAVTGEVSLGVAAGYMEFESDRQAWGDVKVRYYPSARAPRGFAIGALVGAARVDPADDYDDFVDPVAFTRPRAAATAGVFLDYSWLLGRSRRFYVGTGVGAKRVFGLGDDPSGDYPHVLGAGRLQIGYAF